MFLQLLKFFTFQIPTNSNTGQRMGHQNLCAVMFLLMLMATPPMSTAGLFFGIIKKLIEEITSSSMSQINYKYSNQSENIHGILQFMKNSSMNIDNMAICWIISLNRV